MAQYNRDIASRLMADLVRDYAITRTQAAAVVGNLAHESAGFNQLQEITPLVKGSKGGFGFAQWTGPRRRSFEKWADKNNVDIRSYEANYGYLKHEIDTDPYEGKQFWEFVEKSRGKPLDQATKIFSDKFLRPGIPHMDSRIAMAENVATVEPVERVELASLPTPSERPSLEGQLGYEPGGILAPDTAGSISPISTAAAAEMPNGGILAPSAAEPTSRLDQKGGMPALLDLVESPAPSQQFQERPITTPTYMDNPGPNVLEQAAPAPNIIEQAPPAPAPEFSPDAGLLAAAEQASQREREAQIAANPESFATDEEFLMSQPVVPAAPASPLLTPAAPPPAASSPLLAPQPQPAAPPTPSGMDVWQGRSASGVDNTGQYTLDRRTDGNVHRYSSKHDRTDIIGADGKYRGQYSGHMDGNPMYSGEPGAGIPLPKIPGFSVGKAKTERGEMVRGGLGSMGGGLLGGFAGPVGGLIGAFIGREFAKGNNPFGRQSAPTYGTGFPDAPASPAQTDSRYNPGTTREDALGRGFSNRVVDAAFSGQGGLF